MRRASAVSFLLERRRSWLEKIAAATEGDVEQESGQVDSLNQLVLDVRAGRLSEFELPDSKTLAVIVTD